MGRSIVALVVFVGVSLLAGVIGSVFTAPAIPTWYAGLEKPSFTPPSWVFGPVWTTLYVLMGVAAYLVWRTPAASGPRSAALALFAVQLVLNAAWSALFFGLRSPLAGLLDIVLLWLAIVATIVAFARVRPLAAWLLAPYLAWVSYATALNVAILRLNG